MERFWLKVEKTDTCWLWKASLGSGGYGQFSINQKPRRAHRVAWELLVGPIPDGLDLHHKCFTPRCVNPEHLEPMKPKANKQTRNPARANALGRSGIRGVTWCENIGKWRVRKLKAANGSEGTIGYFLDLEEARRVAAHRDSLISVSH